METTYNKNDTYYQLNTMMGRCNTEMIFIKAEGNMITDDWDKIQTTIKKEAIKAYVAKNGRIPEGQTFEIFMTYFEDENDFNANTTGSALLRIGDK